MRVKHLWMVLMGLWLLAGVALAGDAKAVGYAGSDTCKGCHEAQFKNVEGSPHAKTMFAKLGGVEAPAQVAGTQNSASQNTGAKLKTLANGTQAIVLDDPFDKSWRRVGLALERAGFVVEDKNRVNGQYFLRVEEPAQEKGWLDKLAFWRSEDNAKAFRYQVSVMENGGAGCDVYIKNVEGDGSSVPRVIESLYKALGGK